jgi:predicted  nucleic acid-binding Zn-ribbon protein
MNHPDVSIEAALDALNAEHTASKEAVLALKNALLSLIVTGGFFGIQGKTIQTTDALQKLAEGTAYAEAVQLQLDFRDLHRKRGKTSREMADMFNLSGRIENLKFNKKRDEEPVAKKARV